MLVIHSRCLQKQMKIELYVERVYDLDRNKYNGKIFLSVRKHSIFLISYEIAIQRKILSLQITLHWHN